MSFDEERYSIASALYSNSGTGRFTNKGRILLHEVSVAVHSSHDEAAQHEAGFMKLVL